jgi:carbamoyltransferase
MQKTKNMKKDFIVLGAYEGHNASASIMKNGKIIAAAHEERFSKIKNDVGMPIKAMKFCMKEAKVDAKQINEVMLSNDKFNKNGVANIILKRPALYSIQDWIKENQVFWKKKLIQKNKNLEHYFYLMDGKKRLKKIQHYYNLKKINFSKTKEKIEKDFNEIRRETIHKYLKIDKSKIKFVEHYKLHHYHAYYSSPFRGKDVFIAHLEGDGGKYNNAISIPTKNGIKFLAGSNKADIGRLYQWITLILGMKPYHDEYKVMGLAPYANPKEVEKSYKVLKDIFCLTRNGYCITYKNKPKDLYFSIKDKLDGHRFDGIAGAIQKLLEEISITWIKSVQKKLKRKILCYGGGVAMNVKANMLINNLKCLKESFVPISPSDESNAIGACYYSSEKFFIKNKISINYLAPLHTPYLGPSIKNLNVGKIKKIKNKKIKIHNKFTNNFIINEIIKGKIVGRCVGRSEFGQRSLGNRSILASPLFPKINKSLNESIKFRDFWMPFCPTILKKYQNKVLVNKKNINSKFMTQSFQMVQNYSNNIYAGHHPGDNSMRPQILDKYDNKSLFEMINFFYKKTQLPFIINTSFNLHRHPIVSDQNDIIKMIKNSELDFIIVNHQLIEIKKNENSKKIHQRLN